MSKVPELKDELNRKSWETIQHLIQAVHTGRITPHQFGTGIDVLWMTAAGLIDESIIDLITAAGNEAPTGQAVEKRVFTSPVRTIVLERTVGDEYVSVTAWEAGIKVSEKRGDCGSSTGARDTIVKTAEKLLAAGYAEL